MSARNVVFDLLFRGARRAWLLPVAALALAACTPKIGDKCTLSTDCSQLGDRLCDTTEPDGYCTMFNCEPDTCPTSVCVAFHPVLDPACGGIGQSRWPRFERTFCMAACSADSDCRDQYFCANLVNPGAGRAGGTSIAWSDPDAGTHGVIQVDPLLKDYEIQISKIAQIVDLNPIATQVCLPIEIGTTEPSAPDGGVPGVCEPGDAGPPWTPYDGGAGGASGGAGGAGGH